MNIEEIKKEEVTLKLMFLVIEKTGARLEKSEAGWYYCTENIRDKNCISGFGVTPKEALERFYKDFGGEI